MSIGKDMVENDIIYYDNILNNINKTIKDASKAYSLINDGKLLKDYLIEQKILIHEKGQNFLDPALDNIIYNIKSCDDCYYKTGTYTKHLSRNKTLPSINFLIGFCKIMGISFDEMLSGSVNFIKKEADENLWRKFSQNDSNFYIYFPSTDALNNTSNIIHESKIKLTRNKYLAEFDATMELYLDNNSDFDKIYTGNMLIYNNNTITLNLSNKEDDNDYMYITFYNSKTRKNTKYYGSMGYRISVTSGDIKVPCITSCIISSVNIREKIENSSKGKWYNSHLFKEAFSLDNNQIIILNSEYLEIVSSDTRLKECFDTFVISKDKPSDRLIVLEITSLISKINIYCLDINTAIFTVNKLKSKSCNYKNTQLIDADLNRRIFEYIKMLE